MDQPTTKETLAHWVLLALQKAFSPTNIQSGFRATGIFLLNRQAVDKHMVPTQTHTQVGNSTSKLEVEVEASKQEGECRTSEPGM